MTSKAETFIDMWHGFVANPDPEALRPHIAEGATFRSPAFWNPKEGPDDMLAVLGAAASVLGNFAYTKQWIDGDDIILEFTAEVGGRAVKGIDRIHLDADGRIADFEVLIRPLNGLIEVAKAMGQELGLPVE